MVPIRNSQLAFLKTSFGKSFIMAAAFLLILLLAACANKPKAANSAEDSLAATTEAGKDAPDQSSPPVQDENDDQENDVAAKDGPELPDPEATPLPQKEIVICMSESPKSLLPFADKSLPAEALRHAIFEPLYFKVGYEYLAQGLERLPNINDEDAIMQSITVAEGDRVVDSNGTIVSLLTGVTVVDSGGNEVTFDGAPLEMEQMVVDFTLKPMFWSDGTAVTAADSVFSFELASDSSNPNLSTALIHTARYEATGERTVRWTGLPGYRDQTYFTNAWLPLPRQQDTAVLEAKLGQQGSSFVPPLSSGPFVIDEWREDGAIILTRNPYYYQMEQGYPKIDKIIMRFGNGEAFLAGDQDESCDVITSDVLNTGNLPVLEAVAESADLEILTAPGNVFENISFGVNPVIEYAERRPDWFEDTRVRQALTLCTDRERMVEELTNGQGQVIHAYVSPEHPLYPADLQEWPYDPDRANAILDEAGYLDFAQDGRRQDVSSGVPMTITLGTNSESSLRVRVGEIVTENLADCGIAVETFALPAGSWFAAGPQGRLFGRQFDLASLAWLADVQPDCGLYTSNNVTGPEEFGFGGWQNINVTGWANEEFDNACNSALKILPGAEGYDALQQEALRIFARELPAIPLFTNVKIAAVRRGVMQAGLDSSQRSMLWNIYEWDIEE